ncbi:unnamed protein product, partial [Symbiodinium sp. KB8]
MTSTDHDDNWDLSPASSFVRIRSARRVVGHGSCRPAQENRDALLPIFVEHDRALHAERQALLMAVFAARVRTGSAKSEESRTITFRGLSWIEPVKVSTSSALRVKLEPWSCSGPKMDRPEVAVPSPRRAGRLCQDRIQEIRLLGRHRQWQEVLRLLRDTKGPALGPKVLSAAISALRLASQWLSALALLHEAWRRRESLDVVVVSSALSAAERGGAWQVALSLLETMEDWRIRPDVIVCNAAMTACAASSWNLVLQFLDSFPSRRLTPDVISFSAAASACRTQWQEALSCLHRALEQALAPDASLWSAVVSACGDAGEWQRALLLLATACHVDAGLYAAAIGACQIGAQWQLALHFLGEMRLAGVCHQPGLRKRTKDVQVSDRLVAFGAAMSAAERRNWHHGPTSVNVWHAVVIGGSALHVLNWNQGCGHYAWLKTWGLRHNIITRSVAVSAWGRGYRWQQAQALLHSIDRESVQANVFTFTATSSAAEKAQRWRTAADLLCVMGCQSVQPNVQAFSALCSAWAEDGSWRQAAELVQVMQTAGPLPNQFTFNGLARACQRGDSWTHALRLFAMLDEGRGLQPDLLTLDATIKVFETGGQTRLLPPLAHSLQFVRTADGNQEALVLELLGHALLASQAAAFARRRVKPALRRLQGWLQPSDQDSVLAAQFSLGELHTAHVLRRTTLSFRSASSHAWLPSARRAARSRGRSSPSEPMAKELPASMAICSEKQ